MHFINIVYKLYFPKIIYFDFSYKINIYIAIKTLKKQLPLFAIFYLNYELSVFFLILPKIESL